MDLGGNTALKRQLDRAQDGLLVVLEHERQNLYHLPIAADALEQKPLQPPERLRQVGEGRSVA